jgi:glycosyltransferase involved in cell wall biosynthesis
MEKLPRYVLITPARNEAELIDLTLKSVAAQTAKPVRWVIVSDGSTDGTDEIVGRYVAEHPWIQLVRMPERRERNFSGKVQAFNAGYERVRDLDYDAIGSLDADISFDEEYFAFLLGKLAANPSLGAVGTPFQEHGTPVYDYRFVNIEHVSGACQIFRRRCFEEIGGYTPVKGGGIDYIAVTTARMKGWTTRTFTEKVCRHHRQMGTVGRGVLSARFRTGVKDYALGNHPLWEMFRIARQMSQPPLIVGALALACGYASALLRRAKRPVSHELLAFTRREQMSRLKRFFTRSAKLFGKQAPQEARKMAGTARADRESYHQADTEIKNQT